MTKHASFNGRLEVEGSDRPLRRLHLTIDDFVRFTLKVIEAILKERFYKELEITKYMSPRQLGFKPTQSTQTLVVALIDNMLRIQNHFPAKQKKNTKYVILFLDYTAAFDSVPHEKILQLTCDQIMRDAKDVDDAAYRRETCSMLTRLFSLYNFIVEGDLRAEWEPQKRPTSE